MKKSYQLLIALIVLIADIACMFLLAGRYNLVFWISLLFSALAVVLASGVILLLASREKRLFGVSLTVYALVYVIATIGISFRFLFLPDILAGKVAFVHVLILAVFLVVTILGKAENNFISEQQEIRGWELMNFKNTLATMKNAMAKMPFDAPYKKKVEHAYDSLASGQTVSTPEIEELEKSILEAIGKLDEVIGSGEEEAISKACDEIEKLAAERKMKLSNKANF